MCVSPIEKEKVNLACVVLCGLSSIIFANFKLCLLRKQAPVVTHAQDFERYVATHKDLSDVFPKLNVPMTEAEKDNLRCIFGGPLSC